MPLNRPKVEFCIGDIARSKGMAQIAKDVNLAPGVRFVGIAGWKGACRALMLLGESATGARPQGA